MKKLLLATVPAFTGNAPRGTDGEVVTVDVTVDESDVGTIDASDLEGAEVGATTDTGDDGATEEGEASKPARPKKTPWIVTGEDGEPKKIDDLKQCEDWDAGKHKPLKQGDFKTLDLYYDFHAGLLETKAAKYRSQADDFRKLGAIGGDPKKAQKLLKLQAQMQELMAELGEDTVKDLLSDDDAGGDGETAETAEA